jgi:hypothetical protein
MNQILTQSLNDYQCYLLLIEATLRYYVIKKNIEREIAVLIVEETLKIKGSNQ